MSGEIMVRDNNQQITPADQFRRATDVAGVCREIVQKTAMKIGGREYVRVEGWQAIAAAHGVIPSITHVEEVEGGVRAVAALRRIDGVLLAEAEGFVGDDEPLWARRPLFARRAMAQTRAISRVCRSSFAHVVVLIGGNLDTTPAEEMESLDQQGSSAPPVEVAAPSPASGEDIWRGQRVLVSTKTGERNGKAWTLYIVRCDGGSEATTFDAKIGAALKDIGEETPVDLMVRERQPGKFEVVRWQRSTRSAGG